MQANLNPEIQSAVPVSSTKQDILNTAKGSSILFFGQIFDYASRFIFGIIIARWLGASDFGLYNLGVAFASILAPFAMFGLPTGMVRFLPIAIRKKDEADFAGLLKVGLAIVGVTSIGLGLVGFMAADWLAVALFNKPDMGVVLRIVSLCIPLIALSGGVFAPATRAFKQMQYHVVANNIAFNIGKIGFTILFLSLGLGVSGAISGHVAAWMIQLILLIYFLNRLFPLGRLVHAAPSNTRELLSFSLPLYFSTFMGKLENNLEIMFLGFYGSTASVGIYNAAFRVTIVGSMSLLAISTSITPIISDLYHQNKRVELNELYKITTKWSLTFSLIFFLILVMFARPILSVFGREFESGTLALMIMAFGNLANGGTGICATLVTMTGHSKLRLYNSIFSIILTLMLDLLLIPFWGVIGAAVVTMLTVMILNTLYTIQLYKLLRLWPYDRSFGKPLLAGLVAFLITSLFNWIVPAETHLIYLALNIICLCFSFIIVLILLGLSEEDRLVLNRIHKRFKAMFLRG